MYSNGKNQVQTAWSKLIHVIWINKTWKKHFRPAEVGLNQIRGPVWGGERAQFNVGHDHHSLCVVYNREKAIYGHSYIAGRD